MIVVDASVIVPFLIPHEFTTAARAIARHHAWTAPVIWRSEVRSAMIRLIRARRLSLDDAKALFKQAELQLWKECSIQSDLVLDYSARSQCSPYDCEYVVLADMLGLKLVTADEPLIQHFPTVAIHLTDFAGTISKTPK